ncbi:cathelicidin-2-like [Paroedura picta]|uniref:cathelicidin-2-like n=1 Tax=Paroedura picta TaxID=143630 RepID=UPI0040572BC5
MEAVWAALVLLLGAAVANPVPPAPLSYEQALASAVQSHNRESGLRNAFRLLEAELQPGWDPSAPSAQPLRFSIKETECPVRESSDIDRCDYKAHGLHRNCSGFYSTARSPPEMVVQCEDVGRQLHRMTRGRFKKWKKKLRKAAKILRMVMTVLAS